LAVFWTIDPIRGLMALDGAPPMGVSRTRVTHFVPDTGAVESLRRLGLRAEYLPYGTWFHEARPAAVLIRRFRAAVAFAGHASIREAEFRTIRERYGPWAARWVEAAARRVADGARPEAALAGALKGLPTPVRAVAHGILRSPREAGNFIGHAVNAAATDARREAFHALRCPLTVYAAADDWPNLPAGVVRRPAVDYRRELPAVYRAADVNVNITSPRFPRGVNARVFDVPAAGGFLLTDRRAELSRYFVPGREVVVYDNMADLRDKVRWYRTHPPERHRIVERARARVDVEHSWVKRARTILGIMS
jgi:spore maturation protein CgeB